MILHAHGVGICSSCLDLEPNLSRKQYWDQSVHIRIYIPSNLHSQISVLQNNLISLKWANFFSSKLHIYTFIHRCMLWFCSKSSFLPILTKLIVEFFLAHTVYLKMKSYSQSLYNWFSFRFSTFATGNHHTEHSRNMLFLFYIFLLIVKYFLSNAGAFFSLKQQMKNKQKRKNVPPKR